MGPNLLLGAMVRALRTLAQSFLGRQCLAISRCLTFNQAPQIDEKSLRSDFVETCTYLYSLCGGKVVTRKLVNTRQ